MANRSIWKFSYTVDELSKATKTKLTFHQQRHDWWASKQKEVTDKIKSEGIEIDESVAGSNISSYTNTGRGASVAIRNDLVKDLQECVGKVNEHRGKTAEYNAWLQVLEAQKSTMTLELHQDDWLFFFGK